MANKETTPAPQQAISAEESATKRLKQAHGMLMEVQAEINKADALLTPASTGALHLEEMYKVSCRLHHLLASMDCSLSQAAFYTEDAVDTTNLALQDRQHQEEKRRYMKPVVVAVRGDR